MKNAMIVMETLAKWERLLNMKNDFVFAEATFDKELFKDAMKHAFDLFCLAKGAERLPVTFYDMASHEYVSVLDFCRLIQHMSDYASDCFVGDESDDLIFTASQYAVRLFLHNMIWGTSISSETVLTDDMEFTDGERSYSYNIETGDLSDLQKLAKYRESWN